MILLSHKNVLIVSKLSKALSLRGVLTPSLDAMMKCIEALPEVSIVISWVPVEEVHLKQRNSNNHHECAPWSAAPDTPDFVRAYQAACLPFNYLCWYTPALQPYMATRLLAVIPLQGTQRTVLQELQTLLSYRDMHAVTKQDGYVDLSHAIDVFLHNHNLHGNPMFMRMSGCSTKDATDGVPQPVTRGADAVQQLISSKRCSRCFPHDGEALLFFAWEATLDPLRECRAFVREGRITAVSQYTWFHVGDWPSLSEVQLRDVFSQVQVFWDTVAPHLTVRDAVMDVTVSRVGEVRLVELNPYGAHLSSGSALFHWLDDWDVLHGKAGPYTHVRLVAPT